MTAMTETRTEDKAVKAKRDLARFERHILFLHFLAFAVLGVSLFPMIYFLYSIWQFMGPYGVPLKILAFSFALPFGYFFFGAVLIFLCVAVKNIFRYRIAPGLYPIHSKEALDWLGYSTMILVANSAFLDIFRLSPFQILFYRLMGAKVGERVNVNTAGLADLSMLEIGDDVLIGGGVALICHASERGFLKLAPTKIGNGVSIGLSSVIMPGVEIGDGASIAPCSLVPKGTKIPPRGVWGGNPVRDLRAERREALKSES